jgi:beta-galactosidase
MDCFGEIRRWHRALWHAGYAVQIVHPGADLSAYPLILAPALYAVTGAAAANLAAAVSAGAHLLVGPYSGVVDEHDRVLLGGYPGALRELLGVRVEEFFPLPAGGSVPLSDGRTGIVWSEYGRVVDAEVLATFAAGPVAGAPALTRRGGAWYLGTRLDDAALGELLAEVAATAGVRPTVDDRPPGLEAVRRRTVAGRSYLFLLNHGDTDATVAAEGMDLLSGRRSTGSTTVPAGGVVVLREERP